MLYAIDELKINLFSKDLDLAQLLANLVSLQTIANGDKRGGAIALLDVPSRFRWLTAVRSSVIQTSRPHPGLCNDLTHTAQRLFEEMVL